MEKSDIEAVKRRLMNVNIHNAYHTGQIALLRKLQEDLHQE